MSTLSTITISVLTDAESSGPACRCASSGTLDTLSDTHVPRFKEGKGGR